MEGQQRDAWGVIGRRHAHVPDSLDARAGLGSARLAGWSHYRRLHLLDKLSERPTLIPGRGYQLPLEEPDVT